ncbi:hypothetical protein L596_024515 [Steinernema carpocapsae]|uniref:Uncharacterized protein n=1 Tax=Steinernema carpocapsae TaxID=34508 RepID=A0A4U5MGY0_STECR|nr:hypothetical protein L596_024515 [Steinernema carpocapsae]
MTQKSESILRFERKNDIVRSSSACRRVPTPAYQGMARFNSKFIASNLARSQRFLSHLCCVVQTILFYDSFLFFY